MNRRLLAFPAVLVLLCALGGWLGDLGPSEGPGPGGSRVSEGRPGIPFVSLDHGTASGVREPLQVVIRDPTAWQLLWTRHAAGRPTPPPPVDFAHEMVVGYFLGEQPSSGYGATICAILVLSDELVVQVQVGAPPPTGPVLQVLTRPYHLVRLDRYDVAVEFRVVGASLQPGF